MKHILATVWLTLALTSPVRAEVAQVVCRSEDGDAITLLVDKDARRIGFDTGFSDLISILWWTDKSIAFSMVKSEPNAVMTMILYREKMELTISIIREENMVLGNDLNAIKSVGCTRPL